MSLLFKGLSGKKIKYSVFANCCSSHSNAHKIFGDRKHSKYSTNIVIIVWNVILKNNFVFHIFNISIDMHALAYVLANVDIRLFVH